MFSESISNLLGNENINLNKYIDNKLNLLYPDIDINTIDNEIIENIIFNILSEDYANINKIKNDMFSNIENLSNTQNLENCIGTSTDTSIFNDEENKNITKNNFEKEIIRQNLQMADEIIPEMSINSNLIYLSGKLNGIKINTMIDTGATSCVIFKSVVDKCGLEYLIDTSTSVMVQGAHGMKPTLGTIWFLDVEIEINKDNLVCIPISVEVIDDSDTIKAKKIIEEHHNQINKIVNNNNINDNEKNKSKKSSDLTHEFDIILGMTFLKSYRANIDFSSMTITLNKNIKIKFN